MSNPPKERGTAWERRVVDHAQQRGLPWERAPLRGTADLLDVQGCLPDGWLIGCKAISRLGNLQDRMSSAMNEARAARERLPRISPGLEDGVIPVQVIQRQGYPVGRAYVVLEYDEFLALALERQQFRPKRKRRTA